MNNGPSLLLPHPQQDFSSPIVPEDDAAAFQGRIIGGTAATTGQLPWHVWVRSTVGTASITCGGSLISGNWVLTAAHCVQGYTSFTVGAGSNTLASPLVQLTTTVGVVNPGYNAANYNNDLALLQLPSSLSNSTFIAPVRIPAVSQNTTTFVNFQSTVSGFGRLNNGKLTGVNGISQQAFNKLPIPATTVLSPTLQVVNMRVMANANCASVYGTAVVVDTTLCGEGWTVNTQGACLGDSGGPMVIYENTIPTLIGVTSFISGRGCGAGDPTGFTRVSRYTAWINAVTGIALRP